MNYKSHSLTLLFFCINLFYCNATIINPPSTLPEFNPNNTVFMFDVDDVLVERNFWQNRKDYWNIIKECSALDTIQFLSWHLIHATTFIDTIKHEDIEKYLDQQAQEWPFLLKETPQGTILERIKNAISKATPKQETIDILLNLHRRGFSIALATNQASSTLNRIIKNKVLPDSSHFIMLYTADYCHKETLIKKPQKEYYQCFKSSLKEKGFEPNYFIFIDDKYENVNASAKENILSIHFSNDKELENDLATLGIHVSNDDK